MKYTYSKKVLRNRYLLRGNSKMLLTTSLLFLAAVSTGIAKECNELSDELIEEIANWSNSLPLLVEQDEKRRKDLANFEKIDDINELRDFYYKTVTQTSQTSCTVLRRFGGRWLSPCGFLDGEKMVCMDSLFDAVQRGKCLVYSFGLGDDWDFEESMAKLGCTVRAFDPNVKRPSSLHENVHFKALGLGGSSGKLKNGAPDGTTRMMDVMTLSESMKLFGDEAKEITYLKVDVEGAEFLALPQMIESGIFSQVRQMGIEMHTGSNNLNKKAVMKHLNASLSAFKTLQEKFGFRLIAYNANGCMGKKYCLSRTYHNYHDIVFYKPH